MSHTSFSCPVTGDFTLSYHEGDQRQPKVSRRLATEVAAPAGGSIHSTLEDMVRWVSFNLNGAKTPGLEVIEKQTLREIHSPQVIVGADSSAPSPGAAYAMGWFVDSYNGYARLSHGGDVHDVNSSIVLFPDLGLGLVSFVNFCGPKLARLMNEHAFDALMGLKPVQTLESKLAQYEAMIESARERRATARRVRGTTPSHALQDYAGTYVHAAYGRIDIERDDATLVLRRGNLHLPLQHWHYDAWVVAESDWFDAHKPHTFDCTNRILFEMSMDGEIVTISVPFESDVPPIRFARQ
jgi:CubicO group peptidase (beta-lactamase class C family)